MDYIEDLGIIKKHYFPERTAVYLLVQLLCPPWLSAACTITQWIEKAFGKGCSVVVWRPRDLT